MEELPRICYVLGGEDNPLKVGEEFGWSGDKCTFRICNSRIQYKYSEVWQPMDDQEFLEGMINHPERIIRLPQFSEDEKALMRLCGDNGYWQWYRLSSGQLHAKEYDEMYGPEINCVCMEEITEKYTREHPFDASAYLESLESEESK